VEGLLEKAEEETKTARDSNLEELEKKVLEE